ncbi:MAG: hypothetical protein KA369_20340 [Spirochaetes bacterium]|nr:hypothetical protein [Spirochaetota bacterium]
MRSRSALLLLTIIVILISACGKDKIDLNGNTIFKADGAVISYASFGNGGKPGFHSIRVLKDVKTDEPLEIVGVFPTGPENLVTITRKHGLYKISGLGKSCKRIDHGLPPEVIYPFKKKGVTKPVFSHSVSADGRRVALVVPSDVYMSRDGGRTFARLPLAGVKRYTEFLSVAVHPDREGPILIGTSSNGVYYSVDGGATARLMRGGVPGEPTRTPNFLEEIRSLCFGGDGDTFFAGMGNGGGVYRGSMSRGMMEKIDMPSLFTYPDGDFFRVTSVNWTDGELLIGTNRSWRKIAKEGPARGAGLNEQVRELFLKDESVISARTGGRNLSFQKDYQPGRAFEPDRRAVGKHAMYISYSFTQGENYDKLLKLLKYLKFNAVVINLKDDYGSIRVPVTDPTIKQVPGSVNPYKNVVKTIKRLRSDGIYVIARQVCFKDEKVYRYQNNKYAVKNPGGFPFHKGPEKWVDGFSEFVWDYNIAVARELEKAGVDEVQFDYIRFPDVRGEADNRRFDFRKEHQTMREALASFLVKARAALSVPTSIDLFGYNAIYQWGEWIGHDVSELSRHVDAISPMFYPSHYTGGYAAGYGDRRIYYTIYLSCKRARELAGGALLRPYIQAFYYKDNADKYCVDYIGWELDGLKNSGVKDYIFWNDLSEYTILIRGLRKYRGEGEGPVPPEIRAAVPKKLPFDAMVEKNISTDAP